MGAYGFSRRREVNKELAMEKLKEGNVGAASELFQVFDIPLMLLYLYFVRSIFNTGNTIQMRELTMLHL